MAIPKIFLRPGNNPSAFRLQEINPQPIMKRLLILPAALLLFGLPPSARAHPGELDAAFADGTGTNMPIFSLVLQPDGKVLVGGWFSSYGGVTRDRIARLNGDGSLDTGFDPGTGANLLVFSVALQADGKVLIGGTFNEYDGVARNRIARLNSDGSLDGTFDPGSGPNEQVSSIVVQPDGKVLIGGQFTNYDGVARKFIARLNADGSLDETFDPGDGPNTWVFSVALQPDGKVLIGGVFANYNGVTRNRIARLHSDGSLDGGFDPGAGPNSSISSIVVQPDGKVLIGGTTLSSYGGVARNGIARINGDGSLDAGFDTGSGADWDGRGVHAIALQTDGKVLISGTFLDYAGLGHDRFVRLNSNGSLDTSFDPGSGTDWEAESLVLQSDGKVLLGGHLSAYNGTPRSHLARVHNGPATQSLSAVDSSLVFWARGGAAPEVDRVVFELSTDEGASWTALGAGVRAAGGWQLAGLALPAEGLLRARGFTGTGGRGGGLVEATIAFAGLPGLQPPVALQRPVVRVRGKARLAVARARVVLRGTSRFAERVEFKAPGAKFRRAQGVDRWRAGLRLRPGRNAVRVRALGPGGRSQPARVVILRRR